MDVLLALVAALLFALGTILQQKAGLDEPTDGASSGLLLRMAQRPVWLAGIAADALGFVAQAAALGIGRLVVVQPLLVTSVVFALPLGARFTRPADHAHDVGAGDPRGRRPGRLPDDRRTPRAAATTRPSASG